MLNSGKQAFVGKRLRGRLEPLRSRKVRVCNGHATDNICYLPLYVVQMPPPEMGFPQQSPQRE